MASGTVPRLRCLALLALAVLSCLQAAATQLSQPRPFPPHQLIIEASTAATPLVVEAASAAAADGQAAAAEELQRTCTYTVQVKTSCSSSPSRSSEAVSLAFGDAYRNEVYLAQLAPRAGFERCATDTFRVSGPCGYGVCYLYLQRAGAGGRRYGWAPEWVRVYEPASPTPSTFYYGGDLPAGVWYGFNRCPRRAAAEASAVAAAQSM